MLRAECLRLIRKNNRGHIPNPRMRQIENILQYQKVPDEDLKFLKLEIEAHRLKQEIAWRKRMAFFDSIARRSLPIEEGGDNTGE